VTESDRWRDKTKHSNTPRLVAGVEDTETAQPRRTGGRGSEHTVQPDDLRASVGDAVNAGCAASFPAVPRWTGENRPFRRRVKPAISGGDRDE